ncbi:MAG: hypothetical protein WB615_02135, partial [Candidatus Tumulicola sp.]
MKRFIHTMLAYAAVLAFTACSGSPGAPSLPLHAENGILKSLDGNGVGKIQHIIWVVQENRSFDDVFEGYPGADTVSSGKDSNGNTIAL